MKWEDDFYESIAKTTKCPACGEDARINMHLEHGQIVDYFYECECGNIIEQEEIEHE
jgi:C4-type Zn-finger protein